MDFIIFNGKPARRVVAAGGRSGLLNSMREYIKRALVHLVISYTMRAPAAPL